MSIHSTPPILFRDVYTLNKLLYTDDYNGFIMEDVVSVNGVCLCLNNRMSIAGRKYGAGCITMTKPRLVLLPCTISYQQQTLKLRQQHCILRLTPTTATVMSCYPLLLNPTQNLCCSKMVATKSFIIYQKSSTQTKKKNIVNHYNLMKRQ